MFRTPKQRKRVGRLCGSFAPIDNDGLAGEVRRLAGEEQDRVGYLLRGGRALDRHGVEEGGRRLAVAGESVEHFGLDRPGRNGIDAHAARSALERRGLGQAFDRVLARGIDRSVWRSDLAQDGGEIDDAAATLLGHHAHLVLQPKQRAEHIGVEHGCVGFPASAR
jgi:hypothetical protein